MIIRKVINNNVAVVLNEKGKECVVIGKGVTFGKKVGESIDASHAIKMYKSSGQGLAERVSDIIESIPFEHIKVCNEIVSVSRRELGQVDDKIFLTLLDHISFAIERHNKGMEFDNILWEAKRLYPSEYRVGQMALDIIENRLNVRLPDSEATFIAFHLLNANGTSMIKAQNDLHLIEGILNIIKTHFNIELNEESHQFARFMTHLRFFAGRISDASSSKLKPGKEDSVLLQLLSEMSDERICADKIAEYVMAEFEHTVSQDEKSYLIIHIHNIMN